MEKTQADVLMPGSLDSYGAPIGWMFDLTGMQIDRCVAAGMAMDKKQPLVMAAWLGWTKSDLRDFWEHVRRN